ncbi:N-acetyltransferase domain-containing protein [Citrus sinensis]|nr:N-acetyltransferase domain-containing protein [Citrus sinensis]
MSTILVQRPAVLKFHRDGGFRNHRKFSRISATWTMRMDSKSSRTTKKEDLSIVSIPQRSNDLRFDRLQPSDRELLQHDRFEFGKFVAREALLDEEYWTAAWLRAESHWEGRTNERYVDNFKRKFAEQEFNAIKRRCRGLNGQRHYCIVANEVSKVKVSLSAVGSLMVMIVDSKLCGIGDGAAVTVAAGAWDVMLISDKVKKDEGNVKRTVLKSVVGTLDLSIRYLLQGENFPGERVNPPLFGCINRRGPNRYGYIANLCVAKSARRQGIASNMLYFAVESAKSNDVEQVYVHVHRNNIAGQQLYKKMGFKVILSSSLETAASGFILWSFYNI